MEKQDIINIITTWAKTKNIDPAITEDILGFISESRMPAHPPANNSKVTVIQFIQVKYFSIMKTVEVLDMPQSFFDKVFIHRLCGFPWNFQQGYPKLQKFEMIRTECTCCGALKHEKKNYKEEYVMPLAVPGFWNN